MTTENQKNKTIFQTQPQKIDLYTFYMKQVKNYTENLHQNINITINEQNKSIKRKRIELQNQLEYLRQKYQKERVRITQMQEYFVKNCENIIKSDIKKWQTNSQFFNQLFGTYDSQIHIQIQMNKTKKQQIKILKQQVKINLKENLQAKLNQKYKIDKKSTKKIKDSSNIIKFLNFDTPNEKTMNDLPQNLRIRSQSNKKKNNKLKTQASTRPTEQIISDRYFEKIKRTSPDDSELLNIESQIDTKRIKTEVSLPSLRKVNFLSSISSSANQYMMEDCNFMRPIRRLKTKQNSHSIIPEIIKIFIEYRNLRLNQQKCQIQEINWFQKVIFNQRNFDKILMKLQKDQQSKHEMMNNKSIGVSSKNKVKELVSKNFFRLKTQTKLEQVYKANKLNQLNKDKSFSLLQKSKSKTLLK